MLMIGHRQGGPIVNRAAKMNWAAWRSQTEGIEDALDLHRDTGSWRMAGSCARLPKLVTSCPATSKGTIAVDGLIFLRGRRGSASWRNGSRLRGLEVIMQEAVSTGYEGCAGTTKRPDMNDLARIARPSHHVRTNWIRKAPL